MCRWCRQQGNAHASGCSEAAACLLLAFVDSVDDWHCAGVPAYAGNAQCSSQIFLHHAVSPVTLLSPDGQRGRSKCFIPVALQPAVAATS